MSKIALSSNASGTGVFTIGSPNSDTDRTLTLPDQSGDFVLSASGVISNFTSTGIDDNATSTAITIDSSQNVGIGLIPNTWSVGKAVELGFEGNALWGNAADEIIVSQNAYYNSGWKYATTRAASHYSQYNGAHRWFTAASGTADAALTWTQAMTLDSSGNLLVGKTAKDTTSVGVDLSANVNGGRINIVHNAAGGVAIQAFYFSSGSAVGTITATSSSTSYNTSSDYRLKENVVNLDNGIDRLKQIPVHRFNFIADPDTTVDGFIAHEVQDVVPEAITGTKDAVDAEGNPEYQGIDQSKLVPLLTAALQEAITKIEDLESRLSALEAN